MHLVNNRNEALERFSLTKPPFSCTNKNQLGIDSHHVYLGPRIPMGHWTWSLACYHHISWTLKKALACPSKIIHPFFSHSLFSQSFLCSLSCHHVLSSSLVVFSQTLLTFFQFCCMLHFYRSLIHVLSSSLNVLNLLILTVF